MLYVYKDGCFFKCGVRKKLQTIRLHKEVTVRGKKQITEPKINEKFHFNSDPKRPLRFPVMHLTLIITSFL